MPNSTVSAQTLRALNTIVKDTFLEGYAQAKESPAAQLCMRTTGIGETVSFPFLAAFPTIKELAGEPIFEQIIDSIYQVKNTPYQGGVEIPYMSLIRRHEHLYADVVKAAGKRAQIKPSLIALGMLAGKAFDATAKDFTGTAFISDDKPFFAKPEGYKGKYPKERWSNKGTSVLNTESLAAAVANIQERKDALGDPLGLGMGNFVLAVAPRNAFYASMIVRQRSYFASEDTPLFGQISVLSIPGLKGDQWFLFDNDDYVKPIMINEEMPFDIRTSANDPNSADIINEMKVKYSIIGSYGIGWGSSFHAYGSTGATGEKDKLPAQLTQGAA